MRGLTLRGRGRRVVAAAALVAGLAAGSVPALAGGAGATSGTQIYELMVSQSGGTVSATWIASYYVPDLRAHLSLHSHGYLRAYKCTLLYGYGNASTFTEQVSTNSCTFYGLNPSHTWGVGVQAAYGEGGWGPMTEGFPLTPPTTLTCVSGKHVVRVRAFNPVCPAGYHPVH